MSCSPIEIVDRCQRILQATSDMPHPPRLRAIACLGRLREHLQRSVPAVIEGEDLVLADLGLGALRKLASYFDLAAMDLQNEPTQRRFFSEALLLVRAAMRCCVEAGLL